MNTLTKGSLVKTYHKPGFLSYVSVVGISVCWRYRDRTLVVTGPKYYAEPFHLPRNIKARIASTLALLNPMPCYLSVTQTDCDHYQTTNAYRFPCWHLARKALQGIRYHAEGPVSAHKISKASFKSFESSHRDIAAEMMGY